MKTMYFLGANSFDPHIVMFDGFGNKNSKKRPNVKTRAKKTKNSICPSPCEENFCCKNATCQQ